MEIFVYGVLDSGTAATLRQQVGDALDAGAGQVVVDLAGCPYADAASVEILLDAHRRIWRAGGRLVLRAPSARVVRLLRLLHLDQVFTIVPVTASVPGSPVAASGAAPQ